MKNILSAKKITNPGSILETVCLRRIFAAVALVIAVCMFVINYLTPYLADDYSNLAHVIWGTDKKMAGFSDFLLSIRNFYFYWGGRVEGTAFTIMLSYLPPVVVDLLNTLCYMTATLLIYLICKGNGAHSLPLYVGIHVLLWAFVPDYGQVMFWLCGSANYLWASVFVLLLLYVYRRYTMSDGALFKNPIYGIPTFLLGFLAGAAMENMSAGMLVILTLHMVFYYRNKYKIQLPIVASYVGSLAGFLFLVFAPGNFVRSGAEIELSVLFKFFVISYYWLTFVGVLCILWIVLNLILGSIMKKSSDTKGSASLKNSKKAACESLIYLCGAISAAYCMLAAPSSPERTWYIVCVYVIISVGILYRMLEIYQTVLVRRLLHTAAAGAMVLLFVSMADTMYYSWEISVQTKAREEYILEQKSLENLDITVDVITHQYPLRAHHDALTGLSDVTEDAEFWINKVMAGYYGVHSIVGK